MKIKLSLLFLFVMIQISWSQDCDFAMRISLNNLEGESVLINNLEYEKVAEIAEKSIEYSPQTEIQLTQKYPDIFKRLDSCYTFSGIRHVSDGATPELKACKNLTNNKEYSNYEFKGIYCGNALIQITTSESWGFLSVDLKSGLTCYTMGTPLTANGKTAISFSNYYGEEEIALTDLETKKQYVISIQGWTVTESKVLKNNFYLKLESHFQTDCKKETKYLQLKRKYRCTSYKNLN